MPERRNAGSRAILIAACGAVCAALAVLFMPVGLIETLVASSGVSEAVPAAAPPLGQTARIVLAAFAGIMGAGVAGLTWRAPEDSNPDNQKDGRLSDAQGVNIMGFAFSKLTALARGRSAPADLPQAPTLRRADAHPDAPSRPPIFASRDFDGLDIFTRSQRAEPSASICAADTDPASDTRTIATPDAPAEPRFLRLSTADDGDDGAWDGDDGFDAEPLWDAPAAGADPHAGQEAPLQPLPLRTPTHGLTIHELTERLERGLALRTRATVPPMAHGGSLASMPVPDAVPVRDSVARDADDALREALGALRTMAARR